MYLDKPLRAHTLFQAIARTNRRWTNRSPARRSCTGWSLTSRTRQRDRQGTPGRRHRRWAQVARGRRHAVRRAGVGDRDCARPVRRHRPHERRLRQFAGGAGRLATTESREAFAREFITAQGLFEFLWPATGLRPLRSRLPVAGEDLRLGAAIGHRRHPAVDAPRRQDHRADHRAHHRRHRRPHRLEEVVLDAGTVEAIQQLGLEFPEAYERPGPPTAEECSTASPLGWHASWPASHTRCTRAWRAGWTTCASPSSPRPLRASSSSRSCSSWPARWWRPSAPRKRATRTRTPSRSYPTPTSAR
jgi:hypothetical protein